MAFLNELDYSKTRSDENPSTPHSIFDPTQLPEKDYFDLFSFDHLIGRSQIFKDLLDQILLVCIAFHLQLSNPLILLLLHIPILRIAIQVLTSL